MRGLGDGIEHDLEARRIGACLIEGIRNCRRSETAIVAVSWLDSRIWSFSGAQLRMGRFA